MQAGEVIWLLAGIGIGLTLAMLILAGVLVVDGQRFKRRLTLATDSAPVSRPASKASVLLAGSRPATDVRAKPAPQPAAVVPLSPPVPAAKTVREPIVADPKAVEPATAVVDEMMSDLAAEIARVQSSEPVTVEVQPEPEPVHVVADPVAPPTPAAPAPAESMPAPEPVVAAPAPEVLLDPPAPAAPAAAASEAPPLVVAPQLPPVPPAPKVPPLPKVTPARKFAPALPPRNPPAPKT